MKNEAPSKEAGILASGPTRTILGDPVVLQG
ncbi:hypothetical protein OKW47_002103 [Paraburkholderia atlantica]